MSYDIWQDFEKMRQDLTDNTHISRKALEAMLDAHKEVVAERDALAAHIHQLDNVCRHLSRHCEDKHWRRMHELLEGGPTGSIALARLKAEWQAEAMEGWLEQMRYMEGLNTFDCMESAELYAEELRRQAE